MHLEQFWGGVFLSHLEIVDWWVITVADVNCDVNAISGPLNGIIYQRQGVMTGKWCMSKQPLWCQSNFSWSVPGKGHRVNEWVTPVLLLASFSSKGYYWIQSGFNQCSPGFLLGSSTLCLWEIVWFISWEGFIHSTCSSSRIRSLRVSSMTYPSGRRWLFCSLKFVFNAKIINLIFKFWVKFQGAMCGFGLFSLIRCCSKQLSLFYMVLQRLVFHTIVFKSTSIWMCGEVRVFLSSTSSLYLTHAS